MWIYFLLTIIPLLTFIATWINTEKSSHNKIISFFKAPSLAGWSIIVLVFCCSTIVFFIQLRDDKRERHQQQIANIQRITDSLNIQSLLKKSHTDSLAWIKNFKLFSISDLKINEANQSIVNAQKLIDSLTKTQIALQNTAERILSSTDILMRPFSPKYSIISIQVPFRQANLSKYLKRIFHLKDSLESKAGSLYDVQGLSDISTNRQTHKYKYFTADTTSIFYFKSQVDSLTPNLYDGAFLAGIAHNLDSIDLKSLEQFDDFNGLSGFLLATKIDSIGFIDFSKEITLDFNDSTIDYSVAYKTKMNFARSILNGLKGLENEYFILVTYLPLDCLVTNIVLANDENFKTIISLDLKKKDDIRNWKKFKNEKFTQEIFIHKMSFHELNTDIFS